MDDPNLTVAQSGTQLQAARDASSEAPPTSPTIPGYRLDKLLGKGSFGEVWAGVQLRSGLRVAVKVLTRREGLDWLYFKHEVGRLREVAEHPNVVSLIDADLNHDPPHFVMPLLARGSLNNAERPSFDKAVQWIHQIASALRFCHEKGLLHCDLKPSNVMLDEEGNVRLVDYGQSRSKGDKTVTWGTLGFMAPEQAVLGGQSVPNTRWDVYSLGATAYSILTGQCPRLSEADRTGLTRTEDTSRRLDQYRELLRTRPLVPLQKLNPKVDNDLAAIVTSCLELDPERRTDSVEDVLDDLERRRTGDPLLCRKPWSTGYRLRRLLAKPRVALSLFFLALLVSGGIWAGITVHRATTAQFQYDGGVVAEARGDLQQAYLRWAAALDNLPGVMPLKKANWSVRFNTWLPWVLAWRLPPPADTSGESLSYSPDGKLLVAGYQNGQTMVVDLAKGTTRPGPTLKEPATHVDIDNHGHVLAFGSKELAYDSGTRSGSFTTVIPLGEGWAVGSQDGTVLLVPEMKVLPTGSGSPVRHLATDGKRLAVAHEDQTVDVGPPFRSVRAGGRVDGLAFFQDHLQVERSDNSVWRFDEELKPQKALEPARDVQQEALSPTGQLVARTYENAVRLRSLDGGEPLPNLLHEDVVKKLVFSPDGSLLATAAADRTVRVWRTASGSPSSPMLRHGSQVCALEFSPDGQELATLTRLGVLNVWRRDKSTMSLRRLEHPDTVRAMALRKDLLATACLDGNARLYSLSRPSDLKVLPHGTRVLSVAIAPDGKTIATGSVDRKVRLWRADGSPLGEIPASAPVPVLAYSPDGKLLAARSDNDVLLLEGTRVAHTLNTGDEPNEIAFSPDGRFLAAAGAGKGEVTVWDVATGENRFRWKHPGIVPSVSFSPDSKWLLTACNDGRARRFDLASGEEIKPSYLEEQALHLARVSPDEHLVAVAGEERSAHILHVADDEQGPLLMHHDPVVSLAFSPNGAWVATGSRDTKARVWDSYTGLPLTSSLATGDQVDQLAFSEDGTVLATLSGNQVSLWNLAPNYTAPRRLQRESEVDTGLMLDGHQVRVMTPEQWQKRKADLEKK